MNLKRYYTAFNRYKRSKGFGIHSPFAFSFVLQVLRERCPYYAYDDISSRRKLALSLAADVARHPRIISLKNAKMLFRIVCYFNPRVMLQYILRCVDDGHARCRQPVEARHIHR